MSGDNWKEKLFLMISPLCYSPESTALIYQLIASWISARQSYHICPTLTGPCHLKLRFFFTPHPSQPASNYPVLQLCTAAHCGPIIRLYACAPPARHECTWLKVNHVLGSRQSPLLKKHFLGRLPLSTQGAFTDQRENQWSFLSKLQKHLCFLP